MKITELTQTNNPSFWLNKISQSDWAAGKYLYNLLCDGTFYEIYGKDLKVFLLTNENDLISFCTFSQIDDIPDTPLTPWIGFVYTFPPFRGKRRIGKLIEYIYSYAKKLGHRALYVSTDQKGLYENFGFKYHTQMQDRRNGTSLVYKMEIETKDYSNIIGQTVKGTIDRPLGSYHPRHKEMYYPINYGYVDNVIAGDGAEQDVYVFGTTEPLQTYEGKVIAVLHRLNDVEDKWIVALDDKAYTDEEILAAIEFQEQYFMGELCR